MFVQVTVCGVQFNGDGEVDHWRLSHYGQHWHGAHEPHHSAAILPMVVKENKKDWYKSLVYVEANFSVEAVTGLPRTR